MYLIDWLCANRLSLNADKGEYIISIPSKGNDERVVLKLNGKSIRESKIVYLGVLLNPHITRKPHIKELCKKRDFASEKSNLSNNNI